MAGIQLPPMQQPNGNKGASAESMYDATGALKLKSLGGGANVGASVNSMSSSLFVDNS